MDWYFVDVDVLVGGPLLASVVGTPCWYPLLAPVVGSAYRNPVPLIAQIPEAQHPTCMGV